MSEPFSSSAFLPVTITGIARRFSAPHAREKNFALPSGAPVRRRKTQKARKRAAQDAFSGQISCRPPQRLELMLIIRERERERERESSRTGERTGIRCKSGTAQGAGRGMQADAAGGKRLPHSYAHECIHFSVKIFIPDLDKRQEKIQPAGWTAGRGPPRPFRPEVRPSLTELSQADKIIC